MLFFLPFPALEIVINYFKETIMPQVPKGYKTPFRKFIDNYLVKFYFSASATYANCYWSYFADINDFAQFNLSTNSAEVINRQLKVLAGNGKISFPTVCRKLRAFKEDCLGDFHWKVNMDNLNPRRLKVIQREETLLELVREFGDLSFLEQFQEATIINYAFKFAMVNSFVELIPAIETEVEINSDLGPDQTLANFDLTVL